MKDDSQNQPIDFTVKKDNLYREESITDLTGASIRCLIPIKPDGTKDETREKVFVGHTQLMSPHGLMPLQTQLNAVSLEDAMDKFPEAMRAALDEMIEKAMEMQQKQSRIKPQGDSRIIMPGR